MIWFTKYCGKKIDGQKDLHVIVQFFHEQFDIYKRIEHQELPTFADSIIKSQEEILQFEVGKYCGATFIDF